MLLAGVAGAQNRQYPLSKETQRRFEKITGKKYSSQPDSRRQPADELPDYERPTHLIEMSLRFAPNLDINTAEGTGAYKGFQPNGVGMRFSVGPSIDYFFFQGPVRPEFGPVVHRFPGGLPDSGHVWAGPFQSGCARAGVGI